MLQKKKLHKKTHDNDNFLQKTYDIINRIIDNSFLTNSILLQNIYPFEFNIVNIIKIFSII